jgi:hypothetical protein
MFSLPSYGNNNLMRHPVSAAKFRCSSYEQKHPDFFGRHRHGWGITFDEDRTNIY